MTRVEGNWSDACIFELGSRRVFRLIKCVCVCARALDAWLFSLQKLSTNSLINKQTKVCGEENDKKNSLGIFLIFCPLLFLLYFLITYGVCKKRKYCIRMSKQKNSLLLTNVHVFYVLEDKTSTKNFPSVCLSGCLAVRTWTFHVDTITFEGVS